MPMNHNGAKLPPYNGLYVKPTAHRHRHGGLPGNEDMIVGSALTPLRESVTALPASR